MITYIDTWVLDWLPTDVRRWCWAYFSLWWSKSLLLPLSQRPARTKSVALCSCSSWLLTGLVLTTFTSLSLFRFNSKVTLLICVTWGWFTVHQWHWGACGSLGCFCPSGDSLNAFADCIFFPSPFVSLPLAMGSTERPAWSGGFLLLRPCVDIIRLMINRVVIFEYCPIWPWASAASWLLNPWPV